MDSRTKTGEAIDGLTLRSTIIGCAFISNSSSRLSRYEISNHASRAKHYVHAERQRSATRVRGRKQGNAAAALLDSEVYESILWRVDAKALASETLAVGLTGCSRKSGATTIATNLALQASSQHRGRVLLIDANWDHPSTPQNFKLSPKPGLYNILSGEVSPRECERQSVAENLDVLYRGACEEDQPAQVRRELVEEMLSDLKADYRLILVDLPAAAELRSALQVARQLDGNLLVTPL